MIFCPGIHQFQTAFVTAQSTVNHSLVSVGPESASDGIELMKFE